MTVPVLTPAAANGKSAGPPSAAQNAEQGPCAGQAPTVRMTCAQAVVEFFESQLVEQLDGSYQPLVYGYWGIFGHGNVCGVGQALEERAGASSKGRPVKYFRGQNEQGMGLAAMAYAKASKNRRICAATSSIGPGATNMVTAAACAHSNRVPLLLLPGDIFATRRPHPVLQQLEDVKSNYSVNECFKHVSVYFDRPMRPEQLLDSLPKAVGVLTNPATYGPVTLALPQDLQAEAFDFPRELFATKKHNIRRQRADVAELQTLKTLLKSCQRPLFLNGGGVHYSGAKELMQSFVKKTNIPSCESQAGKGTVPDDLHCLGGLGVTGTRPANEVLAEADLLVAWGCRLADFVTSSNSGIPAHCKIVNVNINARDAEKLNAIQVVGDIKTVLEELTGAAAAEGGDPFAVSEAYKTEIARRKAEWNEERSKICKVPKSDSMVVDVVNRVSHDINGVAVAAAGGLPGELHKLWRSNGDEDYHLEYGYSCMGYEVAGGVGVKMAFPEKEVFVMCGDGSWLMMHTEIVSARILGYPITVILVDNAGFGCIHRLQGGSGISEFGNLQDHGVDFVKNAEALGVEMCKHVGDPNGLEAALRQHCVPENRNKCKLFCVQTDPDVSSPGYSWWDAPPPEVVGTLNAVPEARAAYDKKLASIRINAGNSKMEGENGRCA